MNVTHRVAAVLLLALALSACADPAQEHIDRAAKLLEQGDMDGAIAALEDATQANPDNPVAWNNLGNLNAQRGRSERAMELYRRAIEADPKRLEPHYNLAGALLDAGRTDEAIEEYERAAAIDDANAAVYYNLAYALYQASRFDKAWVALEKARARGVEEDQATRLEAAIRHYYTPETAPETVDAR